MATISTYITTYNAVFYQSTLEQTIRHALLFSDEIVVSVSEDTTDGTQALLDSLKSEHPIIKTYDFKNDYSELTDDFTNRKKFALSKCTKDYAILQDDDEVIHEKYASFIKHLPDTCPETIAFRFNTIQFYRSYNHYQPKHNDWYDKKIYMVKNIPEITHGNVDGDPDNFVIQRKYLNLLNLPVEQIAPLDSLPIPEIVDTPVTSFHYGWCRNDAILLFKKYQQETQWHGRDYWQIHEFPFKFENPDDLPVYTGTHPKFMIPIIEKEEKQNSRHTKEFTDYY